MPMFTPNPAAEANVGFDVVQPGTYRMRVKDIKPFDSKSGNKCLKVQLEYVDPSALSKEDGTPSSNPGNLFDNGLVTEPAEKQGRLRNFVEACGINWASAGNTDELIGREVDVKIKSEEYQGERSNKVVRYFKIQ